MQGGLVSPVAISLHATAISSAYKKNWLVDQLIYQKKNYLKDF